MNVTKHNMYMKVQLLLTMLSKTESIIKYCKVKAGLTDLSSVVLELV